MAKHQVQKEAKRSEHRVQESYAFKQPIETSEEVPSTKTAAQGFREAGAGSESLESFNKNSAQNQDAIRMRAFHIHEQVGGTALENWLEAERSIT